tara:strand:- start:364 stop:609 length:246 start_codon:yes stop_codon:yes gene_type:complete
MKQFLIVTLLYFIFLTFAHSEANICKGKKLSKEFLSCQAKNIKKATTKKVKNMKYVATEKTKKIKENTMEISSKVINKIKK